MEEKVYRAELTPVSFLERSALIYPDKVAIIHGERRYTYREFEQRVYRLASHLRASGLHKHDRVAFLCPNTPALLEAHYAVPAAGGILVAINARLSSRDIEFILLHSGARYLFVDEELYPLVATLSLASIEVVRIADTGQSDDPYECYLAAGSSELPVSWLRDEDETLAINYTSGTTGSPKGVMYTYRGAYLNALSNVIATGMSSRSVHLWTLPMFHCSGWCFTWGVTAVGATHVCLRKVDPEHVWDNLEREKVTHFCGAPTVHIFLLNYARAHRLAQPITVVVGGAPPSPTLLERMQQFNIHPLHLYGLTETYGPNTICEWQSDWETLPAADLAQKLSHQGQAGITNGRVRVVNPLMEDVPRDGKTMGEVVMRGNGVARGYYENSEATDLAFKHGWFHSGDIGVMHADGSIELRDRAKDVIISGGENISTIEVEQIVVQHPAVLECAVVAQPDVTWGERPRAFVTLKPDHELTERDLIDFCYQRLAHFKCPVAIEFGPLPKTSTGKIQKYVLRDRVWAGRDKRIN